MHGITQGCLASTIGTPHSIVLVKSYGLSIYYHISYKFNSSFSSLSSSHYHNPRVSFRS